MNGCQFCVQAHEAKVIAHGITREQVQASVRIAAVVNAVAATLNAESVRGAQSMAAAA
jgi:alkyl hydroperoxide reductase subunit D